MTTGLKTHSRRVVFRRPIPALIFYGLLVFFVFSPVRLNPFFSASVCYAAPKIKDYQSHLPRKFKKRRRKSTRFIVIHSTESGLKSALNTLSRGGYTNYLVDRNGIIYRILHKNYRADHAGLSMWDGQKDISSYSIGIELVGYHNDPFTKVQYKSLSWLIDTFQKQYRIPDWKVLEHFRVAYGRPNRYVKKMHRGRKKDPGIFNFDRDRAGLKSKDKRNSALYDPDVDKGRLIPDPDINVARLKRKDKKEYKVQVAALSSNVITATNSAWRIAREDYDNPNTVYKFPNGRVLRGNQIDDWSDIPVGTEVYLNRSEETESDVLSVPVITEGLSAFDLVGVSYKRSDTYYIFPKGTVKHGKQIRRWWRIPPGTYVLAGYQKPLGLKKSNRNTREAQHPATVFLVPKNRVLTAAQVDDVSTLKSGTLMFVKK